MTEETEQPSEAQVEENTTDTQQQDPLEQVYQEFNVDEAAQQFNAQPAQQETVQQPDIDPFSFDYEEQQRQQAAALVGQVDSALNRLTQKERELEQRAVEADIGKAVEHISKQVEGVDPEVIEAHLEAQARKDPKFKAAWDNRNANPRAWNGVINAMGKKMADKFSVKISDQLVENQRAAKQSQQSMAATNTTPSDDWSGLSSQEMDRRIAAIKQDGY